MSCVTILKNVVRTAGRVPNFYVNNNNNYKILNKSISTMVKAKKFRYTTRFQGEPKLSDFTLEEEVLPALKDGDVLCEAEFLSVDPYMRPYMERYPLGVTMIGGQVAKVVETKNTKFPKDSYIFGQFGWRTHTIFNPDTITDPVPPYVLPNLGKLPVSLGLGCLGMPGNTAYFGFLEICRPKAGETVVVTGAAGAVGSLVGQIAKIKGCTVIGLAGSSDKCDWLTNVLGFDHAINYKIADVSKVLRTVAPNGIDCYFDNVGGEISSIIIHQMNTRGRISICGSISSYNSAPKDIPKVPIIQPIMVFKELAMEGFIVYRWANRWLEGILEMKKWVDEGKIKYHETVTSDFNKMPEAFINMLRGGNTGKAVVKSHL